MSNISDNVIINSYDSEIEIMDTTSVVHARAAVDLVVSRLKKNQYTQSARRVNVFSGWSDCSSLLWKCFEKAYGIYIGSWTGEQVKRGRRVFLCKNRYAYGKLTQEEINRMQPGDCIFYGSGDAYHVEMYMGNGQQIGHGSGVGPTIKNCRNYGHSRGVYQVRRYVKDDVAGASGSVTPNAGGGNYMFEVETVKLGEVGNHVLLVQQILNARGFKGKDKKILQLDRECGENTVYAIKTYQEQREKVSPGICGGVDGIAGKKTLQDMIAL